MKKDNCKSCIYVIVFSFAILVGLFCYKSDNHFTNDYKFLSTLASVNPNKTEFTKVLENIYKDRCSMFINKDIKNLPNYYDLLKNLENGVWSMK